MTLPQPTTTSHDPAAVPQLVRHARCPDWGRGALIWMRPSKRAYQFEDGRLRVFKRGFFDMLEPIDMATIEADKLTDRLQQRGEAREAVKEARQEKREAAPPVDAKANLMAQLDWFLGKYPEAFEGEAWTSRHRGSGRRLKRHRDPLLEDARELFSEESLATRIENHDAEGLRDDLVQILETSDVVPPGQRRHLARAKVGQDWLMALHDLLHGDAAVGVRFERWILQLRKSGEDACTWPVATLPLALTRPDEHVLIRRTVFRRQVERCRPSLVLPTTPGAPVYARALDLVLWAREQMKERGIEVRDNLDMYDFMRLTLQKKALDAIEVA